MKPILFSLSNHLKLFEAINQLCHYEIGDIDFRKFPDKETYIKINSQIKNRKVIFIAGLEDPDAKVLPLLFAAKTARDLGAKEVGLITPYLPYMRQDKQFNPGEGITSRYFAALLSGYFNWLITVDPHLHRFHSLNKIYTIPTIVLHATTPIAVWIRQQVKNPLIIGPDRESEQWVATIAQQANAPYIILHKDRKGDRLIEVSLPPLDKYKDYNPILVDDIISSGRTMIEPVKQLGMAKMKPPICIGVHAVFAENAYQDLLSAGAIKVITCNTIEHISNEIDLSALITDALLNQEREQTN